MAGLIARRRTLAPEEVALAMTAGGPLQTLQLQPEKLAEMAIAVVEVSDYPPPLEQWRVVAYWVVWFALHTEPLWIQPEYRKHPVVVSGIVKEMERIVVASGEPTAFCVIEDGETAAQVRDYAARLDFQQAPGTLHYLVLQPAAEPVGG